MATISGKQLKDTSVNIEKLSGYDSVDDKLTLNASTVSVKDTLDVGSPVVVLGRGKIDTPPSFLPNLEDAGVLVHSSISNPVFKKYNGVVWDASESRWIFVQNTTFSSEVVDVSNENAYAPIKVASISSGNIVGTSDVNTSRSITGYTNIGTDGNAIYPTIGNFDRATVNARTLTYKFATEVYPNSAAISSGNNVAYTEISNVNLSQTTFFGYDNIYVKLPNASTNLTFTSGAPDISIVGIELTFKTFGSNVSIYLKVSDLDGTEHYIDQQVGNTGIHITGDNPCVTVRCVGSNNINGTVWHRWVTMHYTGSYHTN